ncbi:hypothetical protein SPACI_038740 [Sporomusa acidovorans DSM 3132]|uniref:Uncharacterized protein n=1 Tax=Sporomusa acidovorans (strain ATCC 49682 / DSM 3132 / Mol) TaxID=1123286 RepID=A0ABZ3J7A1_SPOA4|nr:hypothetical protein SPACI_21790 [Sporomusa acidovorans DSM 3132]SDF17789.1 hypothetical protein SAMN04488499_103626 [Sporomusa acidovorans]
MQDETESAAHRIDRKNKFSDTIARVAKHPIGANKLNLWGVYFYVNLLFMDQRQICPYKPHEGFELRLTSLDLFMVMPPMRECCFYMTHILLKYILINT